MNCFFCEQPRMITFNLPKTKLIETLPPNPDRIACMLSARC